MNYISGLIPNHPEGFSFNHPEKKTHSTEEIKIYVSVVEDKFNLPCGTLSTPTRKTINGYSISEVKRAAIYHLYQVSKVTPTTIAGEFGLGDHKGVTHHIKKAEGYIDNKDKVFENYYKVVRTITV